MSDFTGGTWDDCLARFFPEQGAVASSILAAGSCIALLTHVRKTSRILIYNSSIFEERRRVTHPERVVHIQLNKLGDRLVSYGYTTTRVWNTRTGECLKVVKNPPKRPRAHALLFTENDNTVVVATEERCIRYFSVDDDSTEWNIKAQIDEEVMEDTIVNFPLCSAISPDMSMVAFGYRGHPLTVWELDPPMLIGQCNVALDDKDMTIQHNSFGEVFKLKWHPYSGEVFALTQTGLLLKWNPFEEETNESVSSNCHQMTISRDGTFIATGDAISSIRVYATTDLSLIYQLSFQDAVLDISFSTDSRRLYDIRSSSGNIWEPNTLIRLAENSEYSDHNSESLSETESLMKFVPFTESIIPKVDNVIALAAQSVGSLYSYGTEDGVAMLCEVGHGQVCKLERLTSFMSIEHVAWSEDGKLAAIADLSGKVSLKRVTKAAVDRNSWQVTHDFDVTISTHQGHISQLFFHLADQHLFIATPTILYALNLSSYKLFKSTLPPTLTNVKRMRHPTLADYLLGFRPTQVHVFAWATLAEIALYTYSPPRADDSLSSSSHVTSHGSGSFKRPYETLGRLIASVDSPYMILEVVRGAASDTLESEYLILDLSCIRLDAGTGGGGGGTGESDAAMHKARQLPYTRVPDETAARVREPLAFLSRSRLIFLDIDRWICTWPLPGTGSTRRAVGARGQEMGPGGIEQYYFLPGDWVSAPEARLLTVMPDGTLICPRNGEVATVQASKLRR